MWPRDGLAYFNFSSIHTSREVVDVAMEAGELFLWIHEKAVEENVLSLPQDVVWIGCIGAGICYSLRSGICVGSINFRRS